MAPTAQPRFGHADLQVHTAHGDGMADAGRLLEHVEECTDLDVLAVTDHDDVRGALTARELHARGRYRFEFVPGVEVTTRSGHLLALWVDAPLRSLRPLPETIAAIHRVGGIAIVPHPFSYLTRSIGRRALEGVLALGDAETRPDGIELANVTLAGRVTARAATRLNRARYGLAETGGSDAHFLEQVGAAVTVFPGRTAEDLRRAIADRQTGGELRRHVGLRGIGLSLLLQQQVRGLSATPRALVGRRLQALRTAVGR